MRSVYSRDLTDSQSAIVCLNTTIRSRREIELLCFQDYFYPVIEAPTSRQPQYHLAAESKRRSDISENPELTIEIKSLSHQRLQIWDEPNLMGVFLVPLHVLHIKVLLSNASTSKSSQYVVSGALSLTARESILSEFHVLKAICATSFQPNMTWVTKLPHDKIVAFEILLEISHREWKSIGILSQTCVETPQTNGMVHPRWRILIS